MIQNELCLETQWRRSTFDTFHRNSPRFQSQYLAILLFYFIQIWFCNKAQCFWERVATLSRIKVLIGYAIHRKVYGWSFSSKTILSDVSSETSVQDYCIQFLKRSSSFQTSTRFSLVRWRNLKIVTCSGFSNLSFMSNRWTELVLDCQQTPSDVYNSSESWS